MFTPTTETGKLWTKRNSKHWRLNWLAELTKGMTPCEIVATFEKMEYADPELAVSRFILKLGDHVSDHL
ncbi:TPA: hypothetical protein N2F43_003772 [Salmonella enterica]|nr:hypothetical protein [Salmonella enterica]